MTNSITNFVPLSNVNESCTTCPQQVEITYFTKYDHHAFKLRYRSNSIISASTTEEEKPLPVIKILGTGGTIASKAQSSNVTAGYAVDLTIEELLSHIPDLSTTCILEYEQVMNIDSKDMGLPEVAKLYKQIKEDLSKYDGIVITHGTDTMEETAFFIQSTINTDKPIVFCGSMRPSTAISSDGPMNLYQAIVIASHPESHGRGVLIALNDRIGAGYYITKSNANSLDTFKTVGQGYIGNFVNDEVKYYFPAAKPLGMTYFELGEQFNLPEVPIIYAHQGLNNKILELSLKEMNAKGLVIASMGAGSLSAETNEFLHNLVTPGFPIIYSKRSMDGMVPLGGLPRFNGKVFDNAVAGGYLNPQKARILLQLCLNEGYDLSKIKKVFKTV
ncbi:L-asparaginase 1 [Candida parapsilosis]|uniref:asparaginase n=1 Tax=Candida parapsilosis TaxID=5480 RepID=A0A8X7NRV8_CANPA|nr:L-asparaginase 1 [Candida parapsilosis]KAF6055549.1 L-asparaginase 1 [Candida parapsilosis]KAF6058479.1 L-asparaginase 1 [Candida parapsilosis]KAF6067236.1 L-asparaginase 1 [Candida parapsilosis]